MRLRISFLLAPFLSLSALSFGQSIPKPEDVIGFKVGADYHLATYQQAIEYFRALEKSSPMIKLFEVGKTTMGKPMIYAVITSPENMSKLDRFKEIAKKLSLVKGLSDDEARRMAAEGRAVVYVDGGLHATEVAPAQHNLQLAYDLLTSEDPAIRFIRDNDIVVLGFPNPDGMDLVAEWYQRNVGTPYEVSPLPWLYHKYAGHDNNRDAYMVNMAESQNIARLVNREWFPVVLYNHHQSGPFPARIFVPPNAEPTNPNIHPLVLRGKNLVGSAMGYAFDQEGKEGVISRISYDLYYPGYVDGFGDFFNIISILTETALYRYATPHFYTLEDFPEAFRDFTKSVFYPNPWRGGWWRLKDAVDYCLTSSKAVLLTAAKYRSEFLYNKYRMGKENIERFRREPPYAWIVPQSQWDAPTAAHMLNKMIQMGVEVSRAEKSFVCDGITYPAGTWIVPMSQPFASFVKTMFEEQRFHDLLKYPALWEGLVRPQTFPDAFLPPYDQVGWTLPYQMGVKAVPAYTPLEVTLSPVEKATPPAGKVEGSAASAYLISPKTNNSFIAVNRILKKGGEVSRAREGFSDGGQNYPAGTWIVRSGSVPSSFMTSVAEELSVTIAGTEKRPAVATYSLKAPRIALYQTWRASMDEGWTRWLLEQFEFPHTVVHDNNVKSGDLRERFDVFIIPSMSTSDVVNGNKPGTVPPEYAGGLTSAGVSNLKRFVEEGGTLVTLNAGCLFAIEELGLPVSDSLKDVRPSSRRDAPKEAAPKFVCPGSLLRMDFYASHPVAYGMPNQAAAFFDESPAFNIPAPPEKTKGPAVIAMYPKEALLMSGYLKGENYLQEKASAVEVPLAKGKVILLGFGVQSRAQPHGTFKLLFNSLFYSTAQ